MKLPFTIYDLRFTIREEPGGAASPLAAGGAHGVARPAALNRQSSIVNHKSRSGVALILTLILLSVALVMALAFLAISGHERGSVTSQTDTATTRLAAEAGLAAAEAQIAANALSTTNPYSYGLLVSTNYINYTYGFQSGVANPTNVSYYDAATGAYLPAQASPAEFLQALANLSYLPRPPVFIPNPTNPSAPLDFRFYLDLNRNGQFDGNGPQPQVDSAGLFIHTDGTADSANPVHVATNVMVGDPEWIGVLQHPDQPYGPKNPFIARYAFIALPVGNSLDLNTIHNQAQRAVISLTGNPTVDPPQGTLNHNDKYVRNEGVGTWEMNLAAFLADLNTNQWGRIIDAPRTLGNGSGFYDYNEPLGYYNFGYAFDDARALLAYRYGNNFNTLSPIGNLNGDLFGPPGINALGYDHIDDYTYGQPLLGPAGFDLPVVDSDLTLIANHAPWVGADNTNHFFNLPADLFDSIPNYYAPFVPSAPGFSDRLLNAGTNKFGGSTVSTYDRYTYYRMLAQLGTDSAPESGKMNLNYDNLDPYIYTIGGITYSNPPSATNFMAWQPLNFFTNAADRLLKAYTAQWAVTYTNDYFTGALVPGLNTNFVATFNVTAPFGVSSVPVLVSNRFVYTPAVNRLLQLAANMYDATTTNLYPDIFRPLFMRDLYGNVFIVGYTRQANYITGANTMNELNPAVNPDLAPPVQASALPYLFPANTLIDTNVYGVPWIVGAKKGFPNFNAFSIESAFQLVRKLEVVRNTNAVPQPDIVITNQMYLMNITNYMALSCWNSYRSNYPGPVDILVRCGSSMMLTNDSILNRPYVFGTNFAIVAETPLWQQWNGNPQQASGSFVVPLNTSVLALTNAVYVYTGPYAGDLLLAGDNPANYMDAGIRELPHFVLQMTNFLQVAIVDYSTNVSPLNASAPTIGRIVDYVQLGGMNNSELLNSALPENDPNGFWNTNHDAYGNLLGVENQVLMSMNGTVNGFTPTGPAGWTPWTTAQIPGLGSDVSPAAQQAFFRAFFAQKSYDGYGGGIYNGESAMQAPYTPMAFAVQHTTWGANDPLVHYLASDLAPNTQFPQIVDWGSYSPPQTPNLNYQPWGTPAPSYLTGIDQNPANLAFKDPLVRASDNWDFPANKLPTVGWLGRVHRGTPWQTVYLKSTNLLTWANFPLGQTGTNTWVNWTGDQNLFDATNSAPVQDRMLFDLFTTAINDNATRGRLSVNVSSNSLAAWSAVFSGVTVFSNNFPNSIPSFLLRYQNPLLALGETPPNYTNLIIAPAGAVGNNSALAQIVAGIDRARATFTNRDGLVGAFEHKGDLLATPQLAEQSPFLNWNSVNQQANGISDEMYEWLPQQVMSLVRGSASPRYIIYSYGQALKPAPNGTYLGAVALPNGQTAFGMVTNYQVVAETVTRTVLRLDTMRTNVNGTISVTPPRAVIESFNILPPD